MKRSSVTFYAAFAVLFPQACVAQDEADDSAHQTVYETKSSQGEISFDLTPRVSDTGQLIVDVRANTHAGDLADLDLASLVSLGIGDETRRPVATTALAGHHAVGSVTFDVTGRLNRFTITIASVRGMGELRFEWP